MKQERKDLLTLLTRSYELHEAKLMDDHCFISSRGRVRQICHKKGFKFAELDREAKNAAAI